MHWIPLTDADQLEEVIRISQLKPVAIFKHSTRCSVSHFVKKNLERDWQLDENEMPVYYLDLLAYRDVSNHIAAKFGIRHESPQLLLIRNGMVVYHASHASIDFSDIAKHI